MSDGRSNDSHTDDGLTDDSAPRVTGSREITNDGPVLVLRRSFRASPEDVWAACTEPGRLERWIGTWDGDPADGHIDFRMTAEGEDVSPERYDIEVCEPPHRLVLRSAAPLPTSENPAESMPWVLGLTVTADPGPGPRTTLAFTQHLASATAASVAASIGPGWEYYLDRLVAATDPALKEAAHIDTAVHRIRWEDYRSGAEPYRQLFS